VPNRVHTPEPRARKVLGLSSVKKVLSAVDPRSAFSLFSTRSMRRWFFCSRFNWFRNKRACL
jgi:hypothetical protein